MNREIEKNGITISKTRANRMLKRIIVAEKQNNRTKDLSEAKMVEKLRKIIEEEAECY